MKSYPDTVSTVPIGRRPKRPRKPKASPEAELAAAPGRETAAEATAAAKPASKPATKSRRRKPKATTTATVPASPARRWLRWPLRTLFRLLRLVFRATGVALVAFFALVAFYGVAGVPAGPYLIGERWRLGGVEHKPRSLDDLGLTVARAAVAAEDARFCAHFGVDALAIREAIDDYKRTGDLRGASTITQQTAKNVFLWHGRSFVRKALEVPIAWTIELLWGKRRIVEAYLNIAEFDEGVFGVEAAAQHYYDRPAKALAPWQAARLMAVLPAPKSRHPDQSGLRARARRIAAGAETIRARGDDACFAG